MNRWKLNNDKTTPAMPWPNSQGLRPVSPGRDQFVGSPSWAKSPTTTWASPVTWERLVRIETLLMPSLMMMIMIMMIVKKQSESSPRLTNRCRRHQERARVSLTTWKEVKWSCCCSCWAKLVDPSRGNNDTASPFVFRPKRTHRPSYHSLNMIITCFVVPPAVVGFWLWVNMEMSSSGITRRRRRRRGHSVADVSQWAGLSQILSQLFYCQQEQSLLLLFILD